MTSHNRRGTFQVAPPFAVRAFRAALAAPLAALAAWLVPSVIPDPTLSTFALLPVVVGAIVVLMWPGYLRFGRDGLAITGPFGPYRAWSDITSVRVLDELRRTTRIALVARDGSTWILQPHWAVDVPVLVARIQGRMRAFASGTFAKLGGDDRGGYRVAGVEPHVRVLEDPREPLEARVAAARAIAAVDGARAQEVMGALLEETADPRARRALSRG